MEELKKHITSLSRQLKGRSANIAFWKKDERWCNCTFELKSDNTIDTFIKRFLENVQKDDPKAVVVNSGDFIEANGDGSILVDDMVNSVLYLYGRGQANISEYLDYYADKEAQQDVMTTKEIIKIMEKRLKQLANYERFELSNGNSTSTEMLEIAKFLIGAKKQGLGWEE